jgi:tetratricopeptide (TPR) repeat protein
MGEYHIRNGEYDEAMAALRESLYENRSVVGSSLSSMPSLDSTDNGDESLVSGMSASQWSVPYTPKGGMSVTSSTYSPYLSKDKSITTSDPDMVAAQRKSLGDMITTLSNLGKVHSLRGEDEAAMKYYDEKTKIQAVRMNIEEQLITGTANCLGGSAGVFFGEGHRNIMTEINEDVKALDELFRGISFRGFKPTIEESKEQENETRDDSDAREVTVCTADDEHSAQCTSLDDNTSKSTCSHDTHRRRRMRVSTKNDMQVSVSALPPLRQTRLQETSEGSFLREENEFADAVDTYRTVIDSYGGRNIDKHEKKYVDFLRKYELMLSTRSSSDCNTKQSLSSQKPLAWREEWQLALDIYEAALSAQRDAKSRASFLPGTPRKRAASDFSQDTHLSEASTLIAMGGLYYKLNNVQLELEKYNEALTVYQEALGRDHPHVAGTMKNIGMVLAEQGQLDEAMGKFQEAQTIYKTINERRGDGPCCDVASALSCMGNVHNRQGELEDALRFYGEALSIYKSASKRAQEMGGHSRLALQEVASTLKIMGMVYTKRGELDMAMNCFQDAIDIMRQNFNEKSSGPLVTSVLSRIGGIFSKMGKLEEAMSHYHEAYDLATRTFGTTDHPEVAQILHYIGGIHQRGGKLDEAMRCYKNSAKIYQVTLGRNDPIVATTLVCIGSVHYIEKNLDGAMNYYKEALRINKSAYGTKHPDVIPTMKSIALIHAKKGNFDVAIETFTEVLKIKCSEVGHIHPEVASAHKRIGNVHYQRGDLKSAEGEYRKALFILQQSLGDEHQTTKSALHIVEKISREIDDAQTSQEGIVDSQAPLTPPTYVTDDTHDSHQSPLSSTSFFKRAPKGYESL